MAAMVAALALAPIGACGGKGGGTPTDGGADVPADTGSPRDTGAAGCDPALQDCAAGSKCDFGCQGTTAAVACRAGVDGGARRDRVLDQRALRERNRLPDRAGRGQPLPEVLRHATPNARPASGATTSASRSRAAAPRRRSRCTTATSRTAARGPPAAI